MTNHVDARADRLRGPSNKQDQALATRDQRLSQAVEEYLRSFEEVRPIDLDELLANYSDVADELKSCIDTLDFMRNVAPQLAEESDSKRRQPETTIQPLANLGDFRIIREIGRGGMGIVYEAEQLSLGRRMALKVLPLAATLSVQQLERFKNEARLAASLKHPHIVSVHSVGVERGVHYYAMELIEGCSLAQAIVELSGIGNQLRTPPAEVSDTAETSPVAALSTARTNNPQDYYRQVAKLIADAADALDYAHNRGIVHRDIKPGNLLLDHDGIVSVTDFGLARLEADAGVTMTGDMLGTLRYMSPEQAAGKPGLVDYRTDIHALGATLYELLTMRPAFEGNDRAKLLRHIAEETPPGLRQIDPRIPQDLDTITAKALEKEPADRYQSAGDLAADLRAFVDDRPITARPPSLAQRMARWSRRHTGVAWSLAASVLVMSVLATWQVTKQVFEQRAVTAAVESSLLQASDAISANQVALARSAVERAELQLGETWDASDPLRERIDVLNRELARYEAFDKKYQRARWGRTRAIELAKEALAVYQVEETVDWQAPLREANLPEDFIRRVNENVYELLVMCANESILWSKHSDSNEMKLTKISESNSLLSKAEGLRPPTKGYYWVLATCSQRMGDLTEGSVRKHHDAEALRLRALADQTPPQNAADLLYIATDRIWGCADGSSGTVEREPFRWAFKDLDDRFAYFRQMLRVESDYYNALFFIGYYLDGAKRWEAAVEAWNGCLVHHPDDFVAQHNRGIALAKIGRFEESLIDLRHSEAAARQKMEEETDRIDAKTRCVYVLLDVAEVLLDAGQPAEAQTRVRQANSICDSLPDAASDGQDAYDRKQLARTIGKLERRISSQLEQRQTSPESDAMDAENSVKERDNQPPTPPEASR
ncbi:serine/threonine-protein kinase [Bythopirellula polymerisocia]|uniref:non-specific serine/threonine protein kinase n=1 Tax=Bythopirellula polymerisocia TaxID=2528003 RepID=A0A5C6D0Q4_9BACT|nr:serine/threonine-protein kinase [Bythopirellula polymerisocia]TWU28459.1 Serine/threonine-protein kinase PrkC [Bythopirellula polymerisocia]